MRRLALLTVSLLLLNCFVSNAYALLSMELTRGVASAVPIAVAPFTEETGAPGEAVSTIISHDLQNSGRFKVFSGNTVSQDMPMSYFKSIGASNLVVGQVRALGGDQYQVSFQLLDVIGKESAPKTAVLSKQYTVNAATLRAVAHHISDLIYQQVTGVRGVFSTRLAYVVVQRQPNGSARYTLEISDQDGYNPKPLLQSTFPIMSPAWSPNGKQIAYVSFENKQSSIYVEDVATGTRQLMSRFRGINGAPAWSPDGRSLAVVLSKGGTPNIYIINLANRSFTQVTNDFSINTEPSWAPGGRSLIFTSNRSGGPQIYQKNLDTGATARLTYDGKYNARASFTPDGSKIAMINQDDSVFNIGMLDLDSGRFRLLTNSGNDSQSPSVAPNGSMVLYDTMYNGRSVLAMVASDGSVAVRLPARNGEVQDPAWSPFLS